MEGEYVACGTCGRAVAMILNDPPDELRLACECGTESYPIEEFWIGALPDDEALPARWHRRPRESDGGEPSESLSPRP